MLKLVVLALAFAAANGQGQNGYPEVPKSEFDCTTVADPTIDRYYVNEDNCNQFYRCVPGHTNAYLYTCQYPEEVFDDVNQLCVNAWDAYPPCGTKQSTTPGTGGTNGPTVTSDPNGFYCDSNANGYYPNPKDCASFYICNDDVPPGTSPAPIPCPPPLVYNKDKYYCDWIYNVPPPCGTLTRIAAQYDVQGPACADSERYDCNGATSPVRDSSDCQVFYNCDANIQNVCPSACPSGLVFDEAGGYCNYSYNVPGC